MNPGLRLLLTTLLTLALCLLVLHLLRSMRWRPRVRRLRRQLLGRAWKPILIEPYRLQDPPKPRH